MVDAVTAEPASNSRSTPTLRRVLETVFEIYCALSKRRTQQLVQVKTQRVKHIAFVVFHAAQFLSLSFPCHLKSWETFELVSTAASMVRLDYFLDFWGLSEIHFFCLVGALVSSLLAAGLASLALKSGSSKIWRVILAFKCLKFSYSGIFAIASLRILMAMWVSSLRGETSVLIQYLSPVCLVVFWALWYLDCVTQYDQHLVNSPADFDARPHSLVQKYSCYALTTVIFSHVLVFPTEPDLHLAIAAVSFLCLCGMHLYFLPYYNLTAVFSHTCIYYFAFLAAVTHLFARGLNSGALIVVFLIFFGPVQAYLLWQLVHRRIAYVKKDYARFDRLRNIYQFELILRLLTLDWLETGERCAGGLERLKRGYKELTKRFHSSKLVFIWMYLFVMDIEQNSRRARLLLSRAAFLESQFEVDFWHYKYTRALRQHDQEVIEEVEYVRYRENFEAALHHDCIATESQLMFWSAVGKHPFKVESVEALANDLGDKLNIAKRTGGRLAREYSNNCAALTLVGSFLVDVCNEEFQGNEYLRKVDNSTTHPVRSVEEFSLFEPSVGTLIVSSQDPGVIISANESAMTQLGYPPHSLVGQNISLVLPPPFDTPKAVHAYLSAFLTDAWNGVETEAPIPLLVNSQGYLYNVILTITAAALNSYPVFVFAFKKPERDRECVLMNSNFQVIKETRHFTALVEAPVKPIIGLEIEKVIDNFHSLVQNPDSFGKYRAPLTSKPVFLSHRELSLAQGTFFAVLATRSQHEFLKWGSMPRGTLVEKRNTEPKNGMAKVIERLTSVREIKSILKKGPSTKTARIHFSDAVEYFELEFTDFEAGKNKNTGQVKDAPMCEEASAPEEITEIPAEGMVDLHDVSLKDLMNNDPNNTNSKRSVVSASNNSNSGFKNDLKAQLLLSRAQDSIRRFKCFLLLTIFLINVAAWIMIFFVTALTTHFTSEVSFSAYIDQRVILADFCLQAREYFFQHPNELATQLQLFKEANEEIEARPVDLDDEHLHELLINRKYNSWELSHGQILLRQENVHDLIDSFVLNAERLVDLSTLDSEEPAFFYLYRNSPGETLEALTEVTAAIAENEREGLILSNYEFLGLVGACILVMALCFFGVIMPAVLAIEYSNHEVWRLLLQVPTGFINEIVSRADDRLMNTHGQDKPEASSVSNHNWEERRVAQPHRLCAGLLWRIGGYFCLTLGFLSVVYFTGYSELQRTARQWVDLYGDAAQRTEALSSTYFWLQELQWIDSRDSYFQIVFESQIVTHPSLALDTSIQQLLKREQALLTSPFINSEHQTLLLETAADFGLNKGLHSGILAYVRDVQFTAAELVAGTAVDLTPLKLKKNQLVACSERLRVEYEETMVSSLESLESYIIWLIIGYSILSSLTYLIVFIPTLHRTAFKIKSIWSLSSMIPQEVRSKIILSLKK